MTGSVDIGFDDVEIETLRELQQPECGAPGDAGPGRVLNDRGRDEQPGAVRFGHEPQLLQIGTGDGPGHPVDRGADGPHVPEGPKIARIVHENHLTGLNQAAAHEVDSAARAIGEQDLVSPRFDPEIRQPSSHILSQRSESAGVAIPAMDAAAALVRNAAHGSTQTAALQPRRRQPATSGKMLESKPAGLLAYQPENVGGMVETYPAFTRLGGLRPSTHEESGAVSRLNVPGRDQPVVRLDHRERADVVGRGKSADGRQACLGTKLATVHQTLNPLHDLIRERVATRVVQGNPHGCRTGCMTNTVLPPFFQVYMVQTDLADYRFAPRAVPRRDAGESSNSRDLFSDSATSPDLRSI